jgi:hypothetical protein
MNELTKYIFDNYKQLMTVREWAAYKSMLGKEWAQAESSSLMSDLTRKKMVSSEPQVLALLKHGKEAFIEAVCARILHEHGDEVFLNHCPKCGALARRPQAKQCPKCFFSWHGDA